MKLSWLTTIGTALVLGAVPVLSQDQTTAVDPAVPTAVDPATSVEVDPASEPAPEATPTPADPAVDPAAATTTQVDPSTAASAQASHEPEPSTGTDYDNTAGDYNMVPHLPLDCNDIRVFSARGSNEPYPGRGGAMLGILCQLFEDTGVTCDYEDIVYPANISYSGYFCQSANVGALAFRDQMTTYVERCPDSKLVLMGYSQGASIVGDVLGGGGGHLFDCDQPSNPSLSRKTAPGSNSKS